MLRFCLTALASAGACLALPRLPPESWLWAATALGGLCLCRPPCRTLAAVLLGAGLAGLSAGRALADRLPAELSGNQFNFAAVIIDFPKESPGHTRLLVTPVDAPALPRRVRLSWYDASATPQLGERWQFRAKLKRPRGSLNPGGFDYAGWLHRERIGASGYLLEAERLGAPRAWRHRLRQHLAKRIETLLPAGDARAALLAIALGARHRVTRDAWQRYAETGTSHLMAISGLHIGLAAAGAGLLAWGLVVLCRPRANGRDAAVLAASLAALAYAALSGFAVPAQRALLMAVVAAVAFRGRRPLPPAAALAAVALLVFLIEPLALLAPGYWLSFAAVALLLWLAQARVPAGPAGLWRLQLGLLLGLLPLTLWFFDRVAWLAPVANALVLPVFSCLTVPAALLGLLLGGPFDVIGNGLLWLAYYSLRAVHGLLALLAGVPAALQQPSSPQGYFRLLLLAPLLWVLLPRAMPGRALAWLAFAAVLAGRTPPVPENCADLQVLDVGQGLAIVLRTRRHNLLFDTGPAWRGGGSSAELNVLPFLRHLGLRRLDRLVVSHADQDHAGGVAAVLAALPVDSLLSGEPLAVTGREGPCRPGQRWQWDGVLFTVLHPPRSSAGGNNASCVLAVHAGATRLLLTGDIEASAERRLLHGGALQPSSLVIVPHHGSRTSSTPGFVQAVNAEVAVVSASFDNRWGFPKDDVVQRWQAAGSTVMNTATSGTIHYRACPDSGLRLIGEYRRQARRYWHDQPR